MAVSSLKEGFREAVLASLEETFEKVQGMYLDRGTSLFETLATITAEEASQPVGANCASIAAHVAHIRFYIDVTLQFIRGERPDVDWKEIWRTVEAVTPEEWAESQRQLRDTYEKIREVARTSEWNTPDEVGGTMALLMHNAYHLGEIRQALCTLKPDR